MPTAKPRITVTLEPRTYEVLARLSHAGGESMSALITQLVDVALPSLERVVVVLERARTAPKEALAGLAAALERADRRLVPAMLHATDMGDLFLGDIETASKLDASASDAKRPVRARRALSAKVDPRVVTRGSGGTKQVEKGKKRG